MSTHLRRYWTVRDLVKDDSLMIKDIAEKTKYDKGHVSRLRKEWKLKNAIADAVAAEREACAQICDAEATIEGIAQRCAAAIRARGQA